VVVYAGIDPVTGRWTYKRESVKGTDDAAYKRAEKLVTKLLAEVDKQNAPTTVTNFSRAIDRWLKTADIAVVTRTKSCTPSCAAAVCAAKEIPISKSTRQRMSTIAWRPSASCTSAARWLSQRSGRFTPSSVAFWTWPFAGTGLTPTPPGCEEAEAEGAGAHPPSSADAAKLIEQASKMRHDWGVLVWLVMTTGIRRAEIAALKWSNIDLGAEVMEIRRSYVMSKGNGVEKDTKTHQVRRIALRLRDRFPASCQ
jgi:hypothetical protein